MAAGLGFKDFVTGEVLTAADVDGYLMQGVWVFASAAARDAAVTSPQEGNFAYLKDTNVTTYYTGSAWANLDTTGMTNPMTTTGDTIYSSSGSTPARLGIGSTGNVLTVSGGVPTWAAPASGGGMTLLASGNASTSSSTLVLSGISGSYNDLIFEASDFYPSISSRTMAFTANSVTDYDYAIQTLLSGTSIQDYGGIAATSIDPQYNSMDNVNDENALRIQIFNYADTNAYKLVNITHHFRDRLGNINSLFAWGSINTTSAITSITINVNANFGAAGAYKLWGVK